jgi:outer membrane protein assembly factor BamB
MPQGGSPVLPADETRPAARYDMRYLIFVNRDLMRERSARRLGIVLCLACIVFVGFVTLRSRAQLVVPQLREERGADASSVFGVYLPTDRALSRTMARAKERLVQREYHQALAFLQDILQRAEDSFLDQSGSNGPQLGLKATARRLIGELPEDGRDTYELLQGATARRQLESALKESDQEGVAAVVRQYFHTTAGYEAALVLAQMEADQGHHLAAAGLYQELIDTPRAAERFEPQLSVRAALNHLSANRLDLAAATLRALAEKRPSATFNLLNKKVTLPGANTDLAAWLAELVGQPQQAGRVQLNWLTARGDAARNAHAPGGRPHMRPRWLARVVNDPGLESYLLGRSDEFAQRGVVTIPAARPIAVGNLVVMRTPQNVVAVDWTTGKRVWETREDDGLESPELPSGFPGSVDDEQLTGQGSPLEQRVWDDALVMSLASDGERVYVLRSDATAGQQDMMTIQMMPGIGRGGEAVEATNQLAAYDIRTEGKLLWELDGGRTKGPLAGAFFLGPPLAIDNTLFVMAEIRSAVYLIALDPPTGNIRWQQQLVGLELGITLDPKRRLVGTTPSYAEGILICPTSAGAVIAIDVVKREFAWVYRYRRETQSPAEIRNIWQPQIHAQMPRANDNWLDSTAIIADGRVLVTPPESGDLHCLDLRTGKEVWTHRRGESLFVGCVHEDHVLLVGADSIQAIRASDKAPAWERTSVALPQGALPAGHGYLSEDIYYLPLSTGEIAAIDMDSGELTRLDAGPPGQTLGNMICYRGSVLSQSIAILGKFEQLDLLEQRAKQALADNPDDATALRELAELLRAEGKLTDAVASLKRSFELAPDDPLTREMLVDTLIDALKSDYAGFQADLPLVTKLVRDRAQQIELMRMEAEGLFQSGNHREAWDAYIRLVDLTAEEVPRLTIDSRHSVRSDRWISGRLADLWQQASADEKSEFAEGLAERRGGLTDESSATELRHYVAHFEMLPGGSDVRRTLATYLIEHERDAEAELELLQMWASGVADERSDAAAQLARLHTRANSAHGETPLAWPRGRVSAQVLPPTSRDSQRENQAQERQPGYRPLRIEQDFSPGTASPQWLVSADCTELVGRSPLGDDVFRLSLDQNNWARQYRDSTLIYAARLGHLLFVASSGQIMAVDSWSRSNEVEGDFLWRAYPMGRYFSDTMRGRRPVWAIQNRAGRRPVYHAWSDRKRMPGMMGTVLGSLGPVTPRGVVFQEQNQLKCVDPLSGETLWARTDIPAGCELFGDSEFVFAADVSEHEAYVVRMTDGKLEGKRELPRSEWLLTAGRNVAALGIRPERERRDMVLTVVDIWSQETLYKGEFPITSRVAVVEPHGVAMCARSGKFQLVDVRSGRAIVGEQLEESPDLQIIQPVISRDALFLIVSGQVPRQQHKPIGQFDYPIASGQVYAFGLADGQPLWPGPATIRNRGLVFQPDDIPFLVFADRQMPNGGAGGGKSHLRLLCIDKQTGETVYRNDQLPDTAITRFRIRVERGTSDAERMVTMHTNAGRIQLTRTDRPRPPRPPANDDLEAEPEQRERGLAGVAERLGEAFRGSMQRDSNNERTPRGANGAQDQRRPVEVPQQLDDD